jgi:hypothetical protein
MKLLFKILLFTSGITHAADIPFTLDKPGNVSAPIYDKDGRMVRELARALPMQAGSHQFAWDGLDRSGAPLPAGYYTWKMLRTPGLEAKFLGMVGITSVPPGLPIKGITLRNIDLTGPGGITDGGFETEPNMPANGYPQGGWFAMPASGLYLRHAEQIRLENVRFTTETPDARPPMVCVDVKDLKTASNL